MIMAFMSIESVDQHHSENGRPNIKTRSKDRREENVVVLGFGEAGNDDTQQY